jgi:hypothetical protein
MSTANLDHDLYLTVAHLNADQRLRMAKRLARWSRQLRASVQSGKPRRTLRRLGGRMLALN